MKKRSRDEINRLIDEYALMPLFNPDNLEVSKNVIEAAYQGGVRLFECTNRSSEALAIFKQLAPWVREKMPDMVLGAGTIMDAAAADAFLKAGAEFIVAPVITAEVASYCKTNDVLWCPGAATLTEIVNAHGMGADMVKIFPANFVGGPGFVKAIKAPCPWLRVMPTGGVDGSEKNLSAWFEAGVACVGLGSQLFTREILAAKDYAGIRTKTKEIVDTINTIRAAKSKASAAAR